ncbi:MAG: hypothetical protein HQ591_00255 [candidate division Zixibacteria bacterium]|nr:hypothetical protein [Candidatus Tariuqbacter arcticus]
MAEQNDKVADTKKINKPSPEKIVPPTRGQIITEGKKIKPPKDGQSPTE